LTLNVGSPPKFDETNAHSPLPSTAVFIPLSHNPLGLHWYYIKLHKKNSKRQYFSVSEMTPRTQRNPAAESAKAREMVSLLGVGKASRMKNTLVTTLTKGIAVLRQIKYCDCTASPRKLLVVEEGCLP
jgi:hypothetical protein